MVTVTIGKKTYEVEPEALKVVPEIVSPGSDR